MPDPLVPRPAGDDPDPVLGTEVLIGRMLDAEASEADRRRFDSMAMTDPSLWKRLALSQQDQMLLTSRVERELNAVDQIDLPARGVELAGTLAGDERDVGHLRELNPSPGGRVTWLAAVSGWAAVITVAALWGVMSLQNGPINRSPNGDGLTGGVAIPA